ncbi:MAG: J domain-containing protein [Clostridia bacterium]|nr:J domain-containing protein [Clostridia bacterium]
MNPYKVLGVPENADAETVKKAYYDLVKKYHPDKYANNPLKDLAEEKLKEVNEAYDMIMNGASSSTSDYNSAYSGGYSAQYIDVRNLINHGMLDDAAALLEQKDKNSAEYFYLMGVIAMKRGWIDRAINYFNIASAKEPNNAEYRNARDNITNRTNAYRNVTMNNGGGGMSPCDCCSSLLCADCCCECMGGDLIPCC